jgi:uncharacterized membrane protein
MMAHVKREVRGPDSTFDERRDGGPDERLYENVGGMERLVSAVLDGALLLRSVMKPTGLGSKLAALFGVGLLHRAATGHCAAYQALGLNTTKKDLLLP